MTTKTEQTNHNGWWVLAVISIPVFVGSLDLTVVSAFLPELINELNIDFESIDSTAWILTAYLLAYTISLTFMGRVSDLVGRKWVYAISLIVFMIGSVMVAVAHQAPTDLLDSYYRQNGLRLMRGEVTLHAIIIGRVVQAIGAGAMMPVTLALVADLFPPGKRAQPLGFIGALDTLGWVLGHLYGGIFIQFMPWQGLFWINVPLTLFALFVTLWALRKIKTHRASGRLDVLGLLFIGGSLTALNIGLGSSIDFGGMSDFDSMSTLPPYAGDLLIISLLMFIGFIVVELYDIPQIIMNLFRKNKRPIHTPNPLIDIRLFFQRPNIGFGSVTNFFIGYCLFIGLVSVPILVNIRLESSSQLQQAALEVGILLSALTIPMAIATIPGGLLSQRIGNRLAVITGLVVAGFGFALIWLTWDIGISRELIVIEMAIVGIGIGLTFSPISATVINAVDDSKRGMAGALVMILRLVGMTISVSSLTTFALHRVRQIASQQSINVDNLMSAAPNITVEVLGEFGLIGMGLCLLAIIPAYFIKPDPPEFNETTQ
jgi:MFS family permease